MPIISDTQCAEDPDYVDRFGTPLMLNPSVATESEKWDMAVYDIYPQIEQKYRSNTTNNNMPSKPHSHRLGLVFWLILITIGIIVVQLLK